MTLLDLLFHSTEQTKLVALQTKCGSYLQSDFLLGLLLGYGHHNENFLFAFVKQDRHSM